LLARYTAPLIEAGADTLVLGCTHYPFLRPVLAEMLGPSITLLDTGEAVARRVASLLDREGQRAPAAGAARIAWWTSGDPAQMVATGARLWGAEMTAAQRLPPEFAA
jgi:glutamate racemase